MKNRRIKVYVEDQPARFASIEVAYRVESIERKSLMRFAKSLDPGILKCSCLQVRLKGLTCESSFPLLDEENRTTKSTEALSRSLA